MNFRRLFSVLLVTFGTVTICGQQIQREWVRTWSSQSAKTNQAAAAMLAPDGGVVVAGSSQNAEGDFDYQLIKYAPNGNEVWRARYDSNSGGDDTFRGMAIDPNGNVFVTGTSHTVKYNRAGALIWTVPTPGRAIIANTNYIYITGISDVDIVTAQLENNDTDGQEIWRRTIDGTIHGADIGQVITLDSVGNVYVAGREDYGCIPRVGCRWVFGLVSYCEDGTQRFYGRNSSLLPGADAHSIAIGPDGLIYVFGQYSNAGMLSAFNALGENIRDRSDVGIHDATKMTINTQTGDVYYTGIRRAPDTGVDQARVVRIYGDLATTATYMASGAQEAGGSDVAIDSEGRVYVAGYSQTAGNSDVLLWKLTTAMQQLSVDLYDSPQHGADFAKAIVIDKQDNVYVTGYSTTLEGGSEFLTIKYFAAPSIEHKPSGAMHLKFHALPGQQYTIESTTNFLNWQNLITTTADTNGLIQFDDARTPTIPYRFYRGSSSP